MSALPETHTVHGTHTTHAHNVHWPNASTLYPKGTTNKYSITLVGHYKYTYYMDINIRDYSAYQVEYRGDYPRPRQTRIYIYIYIYILIYIYL